MSEVKGAGGRCEVDAEAETVENRMKKKSQCMEFLMD